MTPKKTRAGFIYKGVCLLFFLILFFSSVMAEDIYEEQLNRGIKNNEPYSYALLRKADTQPDNKMQLLSDAIKHSPDVPAFYFEFSKATLPAVFESLRYAVEGMKAYKRNFWWLLSLIGLIYISLIISFALSIIVVLLIRLPLTLSLLSHDIVEEKRKLFIPLLLLIVSFFGTLFFIAGALFITGLYLKKMDKVVVYLGLSLILFSPFLLRQVNILLGASSPELRAIVSVNEGRDNKHAIQALGGKEDFTARFSYALALKREGMFNEAIAIYNGMLLKSKDYRVYINLGNSYVGIEELLLAKEAYEKSISLRQTPTGFYNLSQVYRDTFDFPRGDEYFLKATSLGRDLVSSFTSIASRNPNRFVIDETLSKEDFWKIVSLNHKSIIVFSKNQFLPSLLSGALIIIFFSLSRKIKKKAERCIRCGEVFCDKCSKKPHREDMCSNCYSSFINPAEKTPRERVSKLLSIHERKDRLRKTVRALSFTLPGIAHIYGGKVLVGQLYLWLTVFLLLLIILNPFLKTGLLIYNHNWLNIPAIFLIALLYLISNLTIQRRLRSGWL